MVADLKEKCAHQKRKRAGESLKIPAHVRAAMTEIAREYGRQGGKKARNSAPEERSVRARKASPAEGEGVLDLIRKFERASDAASASLTRSVKETTD